VGAGGVMGPLQEIEYDKIKEVMTVNMFAPMMMTRKLIDRLRNRNTRSALITVASHQATTTIPKNIPYASTKAFLAYFNEALMEEFGTDNIDYLLVCPGAVITRMTNFMEKCYHSCTPDECVRSSLKNLGRTRFTYGHWKHEIWMGLVTNFKLVKQFFMKDVGMRIKKAGERMEREEGRAKVE